MTAVTGHNTPATRVHLHGVIVHRTGDQHRRPLMVLWALLRRENEGQPQ